MVYDPNLGYDPEEWEVCPPPDHFLAFGWFTRICLAAGAVVFAFLFFYCLEQRKRWSAEERRASLASVKPDPETLERLEKLVQEQQYHQNGHEASPSSGLRRRQKRLSEQDLQALDDWENERQRLEQKKLEELALHDKRGNGTPKTPPSSPPNIEPVDYQKLAADLEKRLLDEIRNIDEPTNSLELHQRLKEKHEPEVRRAEQSLANNEAEELRKSFTKTLDNAIEQYNRNLNEQVFGNDSDFEQPYKDSPYFVPSESDDAEHAHSFVFESPNAALNQLGMSIPDQGQAQQQGKVPSFQQVQDQPYQQGPPGAPYQQGQSGQPGQGQFSQAGSQGTPVAQHQPLEAQKKSSSSSDEGFVKVYNPKPEDLLKNIEQHRAQIDNNNRAAEQQRIQAQMPDFRYPGDDRQGEQRPDSYYEQPEMVEFVDQPQTVYQGDPYQQGQQGQYPQQGHQDPYQQVQQGRRGSKGQVQPGEAQDAYGQQGPQGQQQTQAPGQQGQDQYQSQKGQQLPYVPQSPTKKFHEQSSLDYLEELHDHLLGEAPLNYPGPQGQTVQRPRSQQRDDALSPQELQYLAENPQVQPAQVQRALEEARQENSPFVVVEHDGEVDLYPSDEHKIVKRTGAISEGGQPAFDGQIGQEQQGYPGQDQAQPQYPAQQDQAQRGQKVEQGQLTRRRPSQTDLPDPYDNLKAQQQYPGQQDQPQKPGQQHYQDQQQYPQQEQQYQGQPGQADKIISPSKSEPHELHHKLEAQQHAQSQQVEPAKDLDSTAEAHLAELLQEYDVPVEQLKRREQREHVPSPEANVLKMKLHEQGVSPGQGTPIHQRRLSKQSAVDHRSATQPPNDADNYGLQFESKKRETSEQPSRQDQQGQKRAKTVDGHEDDPRRQVEADIYLQDAMEYVDTHKNYLPSTSGFVIEEDMLESDKQPYKTQNASADPTSRQVPTHEVFEKHEMVFDDADDAVTYAPEIQSVEIPPDQISQASSQFAELPDDREIVEHLKQAKEASAPHFVTNDQQDNLIHRNSPKNFSGPAPVGAAPAFSVKIETDNVSVSSRSSRSLYKQSSLLSALGVTSMQEMLLELTSFEQLSEAMRKAGLERVNLIFGVDYTASNKYQGENSFDGRSLHYLGESYVVNPYQKVIMTLGRALVPFAAQNGIPVYGFGDNTCGDWGVFPLNGTNGICKGLDDVLRTYNEVTPTIGLSGPTNFAPLIYQAIQICQRVQDYHILVIIADGQVTNERATRKAIVQACQWPLSIIVVGVGDGPWEMMRVFDESLPKRPWDNFHFVEFHDLVRPQYGEQGELAFAIHSLLEVPDQYHHITKLGMLPARTATGSRRSSFNR
ncbi:unnamed protein product [Bursaphelenchus okinawaensis]|uniref:VWFA domain-containing protein n=1 Tax=Bursaphelenchus okinawaensis TaxID=465554 RepID=A0A811KAM4_9BILA|nr:unnamed protein product [Bursaphelenchus okinawaensis]CAG9096508.1 unnamed protein product [Bursaphelenchus okinawaensis]